MRVFLGVRDGVSTGNYVDEPDGIICHLDDGCVVMVMNSGTVKLFDAVTGSRTIQLKPGNDEVAGA